MDFDETSYVYTKKLFLMLLPAGRELHPALYSIALQ
jgi:hypothetical protein